MTHLCTSAQDKSTCQDPASEHQQALRQAMEDFLLEASSGPSFDDICLRCGQPLKFIDTTLWFYGEDHTFHIRVPVCPCKEKKPD